MSPARLPMNGIDRFFVAQDYPGMHANSHHFVDTERPLDRAALERALASLMADVPLARSRVREHPFGVRRYAPAHAGAPPIEGIAAEATDRVDPAWETWLDRRFDLARDPPVRVAMGSRVGGGARAVLTIHHSIGDGTAGLLLLDALVRRYNHAVGAGPAPGPIDAPLFHLRDVFRSRGLAWSLRMARRHVRPMDKVGVRNASLLDDETPRPSGSRHHILDIEGATTARVKERAAAHGLSRNDILLACALRAADAWRRARGKGDRAFRVLLPTDLRTLFGMPPTLQNFVGVVRSDFSVEDVRAADLAPIVAARIMAFREIDEAVEAPYNLGILATVLPPWLFRRALRRFDNDPRSFFFSFLWSHIRIPESQAMPAGAGPAEVWIRGSLPRQPGFGIVICAAGPRVRVAFEYLPALVSAESVGSFGAAFATEVERAAT